MLCTKKFFGGKEIPEIDISDEKLKQLVAQNVNQGLTVPGVQKKLSMHLDTSGKSRLTLVGYPTGYILKPQTPEYACMPEAEDMVMDIADIMNVHTVPHGLLRKGTEFAYITQRVDRITDAGAAVGLLAMEDFCQLSNRLTEDKYRSSYEQCGHVISRYSARAGLDMSEFFLRLVVCFLTGNSDMHLKNFSLIETAPGNRIFVLSPAYDLLPVNILMPEDQEETALTMNGKKSNLHRKDFMLLAERCQIPEKAASKMISGCINKLGKAREICPDSFIPDSMKESFINLMDERAARLS